MRTLSLRSCIFALVLLTGSNLFSADSKKPLWVSGRVVAVSVNAHSIDEKTRKGVLKNDLWWNYCIASKKGFYSVLSRETPAKAGLKENSSIQFMESKNQIYVVNPSGKRIALKILRKGDTCP